MEVMESTEGILSFITLVSTFSGDDVDTEQIDRGVSTLARLVLELEERRIERENNKSSNEKSILGVVTG